MAKKAKSNNGPYICIAAFCEKILFDKDGVITSMTGCSSWKDTAQIVCDGGTTWGVIYDVTTKKFSDLAVDGIV